QLEQLYPYLREDEPVPGPMQTMGAPVEHLDLATVIKVSQAISSEIVLEKLIDALMRTALQQAGADRGALLLLQMGVLRIAAEATTDGSEMVVSLDNQLSANADLPQSVLQYVQRTLENVILDDATVQNPFTTDSYICQSNPRSVLCLPLLNQGKLIGILYLENKLAPRVFVPARIAVLKLLASQAAISLENSRLYRDLAEREARIRRLVEGDIIGVFIWDLKGRIYEANETFLRMMGCGREDLAAGRLNWRELTPPEWHETDERHLQDVRKTGRVPPFEKEYFRKNGTRVPILLGAVSFDEDQSQGVAFVLDLTERKRAEEAARRSEKELRDVLEQVPAMVFAVLEDGSYSYVSTQWYDYTGQSKAETINEGWQKAIHSEDAEQHMAKYSIAVADGQPFESEVRLRRAADGQYRWFLIRVTPLRDEAGNVVKWYGFISDIEDRKRAEQERERLRKLEAELAHMNRVSIMGELTASIAHEINQPLTVVVSNANACARMLSTASPDLDEVRLAVGDIADYGRRASEVLARIRGQLKKSPSAKSPLNIGDVIVEVLPLLRGELEKRRTKLDTHLQSNLPLVLGDRIGLQQVLINLLMNGIESMSSIMDRPRVLTVQSRVVESGEVEVAVRDCGVGISVNQMRSLFDPFFTTKPGGMGMGLPISRSIIEAHGGKLWASSNANCGARFQFTLPAA
ncbi:MAG TPA: PAS domain S-box protein, partial [Candidatus Acidoferrum sp.]|nr:PAS domain S-box protein [Candidatus Acidoferrum sp.]